MVDHLFLLAVGALGWGLSLATYRSIAELNGWPLGAVQANAPQFAVTLGLASIAIALPYAGTRGIAHGGVVIVLFGLALAAFWSGFLRVGAQTALLLAPLAAALLLLSWMARALAA
jgi:hypothetical protein